MDRMIYLSMQGAKQLLLAQATTANNLANVSTPGFKQDLDRFEHLPVYGPGYPSRVYANDERVGTDLAPGAMMTTGRDLDIAISDNGWLSVQAADGSEAYSRRGDLRISENGVLIDGAGQVLLGNGGPIVIPANQALNIGTDGTITIRPLGQSAETLAVIDRLRLVKPEPDLLIKGEDGLMRLREGGEAEVDAEVKVLSGVLENSNVNAVEAMVRMIEYARAFEAQVKFFETAETNDQQSAQIMRLN